MAVSSSCDSKPLGQGKDYHYSVLYNYYEGPASKRKDDHLISWKVLKALKKKLSYNGYDKVMYHDIAIPGSNMFDMLFNMVNKSEKIVVLLTPDFLRNGWHKYSQQAAMKKLIDKHVNTSIVPIGINIDRQDIPEKLGLSVSIFISMEYGNDIVDKGAFDKVLAAFSHKPTEGHCKQNIVQPVQPVQASNPHNNRRNCDCSSLEVDAPESVDDAEDGDREASRGNAASTIRNAQEQFADSNSANQQDDGYKSDFEQSEHTPMSSALSSMHLGGTQNGPTQLVTSKSDPEVPKRQEGDGAHGEAIKESNRKKGEPGKEQANTPSDPPQTLIRRSLSWFNEKFQYLGYGN